MRILLLGAPGAGKGTQAEILAQQLSIPHIAPGDMFRSAVKEGTPLGLVAKGYMEKGKLVPDDVTIGLMRERLRERDCSQGFILDGFPRTAPQAEALQRMLEELASPLDLVVNLDVPGEKLIARLSGRRVCVKCGATYHVEFNPSKVEGRCDVCQGELIQRDDDREQTVRNRLEVYEESTRPLVDYYSGEGILVNVDGDRTLDEVTNSILCEIEALHNDKR